MFSWKRPGPAEWLVVGLGNPGPKYEWTRHNVGFLVIDQLADREKLPVQRLKHKALTNTALIGGKPVLLMKPTTYMNLSGEAVGEAARFYKIPPDRVLVISDDVSLPQGKLRVRRSGSAGGHNGLKNIISHLGTDQFPRIKVGVGGKPHPDSDMADWVLSKFTGPDRPGHGGRPSPGPPDAVTCLLAQGVDQAWPGTTAEPPVRRPVCRGDSARKNSPPPPPPAVGATCRGALCPHASIPTLKGVLLCPPPSPSPV